MTEHKDKHRRESNDRDLILALVSQSELRDLLRAYERGSAGIVFIGATGLRRRFTTSIHARILDDHTKQVLLGRLAVIGCDGYMFVSLQAVRREAASIRITMAGEVLGVAVSALYDQSGLIDSRGRKAEPRYRLPARRA